MTIRAVIYARVCVDDGQNLAEQLESCRECAQKRGWEVAAELAERGVSGLSNETPQLDRVLAMAHAGEFKVLIVREPNRLSRNLVRALTIMEQLEQAGIRVLYTFDNCHNGHVGAIPAALMKRIVVCLSE